MPRTTQGVYDPAFDESNEVGTKFIIGEGHYIEHSCGYKVVHYKFLEWYLYFYNRHEEPQDELYLITNTEGLFTKSEIDGTPEIDMGWYKKEENTIPATDARLIEKIMEWMYTEPQSESYVGKILKALDTRKKGG